MYPAAAMRTVEVERMNNRQSVSVLKPMRAAAVKYCDTAMIKRFQTRVSRKKEARNLLVLNTGLNVLSVKIMSPVDLFLKPQNILWNFKCVST
jgi:hypothetical protein